MDRWRKGLALTLIVGFVIVLVLLADTARAGDYTPPEPTCWEDEVRVVVYDDPNGDMEGTVGCVPADNLPVDGFRP